jgi:PKD repeat protein
MTLPISGAGAAPRILSQPAHGSVGLNGQVASYFPDPGFVGTDTFTFAAWDGSKNSDLATATISVAQGPFSIDATALVSPDYPADWSVPFAVVANPSNVTAAVTYDWDFGDGSAHSAEPHATHAYRLPGTYQWTVISKVQGTASSATATNAGQIVIGNPVLLASTASAGQTTISWPLTAADSLLEQTGTLGIPAGWSVAPDAVRINTTTLSVTRTNPVGNGFFRLRRVW